MNGQGRTPETSFLLMPLNFENPAQILEKTAKLPLTNEVASLLLWSILGLFVAANQIISTAAVGQKLSVI